MVLLIIMSGILFGASNVLEKYVKDNNRFSTKLSQNEIELIEFIEQLEMEMIKKGINPDHLTLMDIDNYLKEKILEENTPQNQSNKNEKYIYLRKKIQEHMAKNNVKNE